MKAHDRGLTLIEVLVALTVLTVGMLGLASMLLGGLQASRIALQHSQAVALAADVADCIRANRAGGNSYALAAGTTLSEPTRTCSAAGECTAPEMAATDLYRWQQSVLRALPGAQTAVTVTPVGTTPAHAYAIRILWTQSGDSAAAEFSLTVQA
jgi:type IV pilus assembly protein PilV